jgi:SAM-dependent methyltransferase
VNPETLARQIGYSREELAGLPEGANLGLSCGNPAALAALKPGEVVLDLGAGAGFDVFLAGPRVGANGRAIGVDMTVDMIERARASIPRYRERTGLDNVEFRLGEIEHLPVADRSVDVVISNCVLNLSTDKAQVWREIARVLRPGGRVAVSDLALVEPLPPAVLALAEAWVGCVAGAPLVAEHEAWMRAAGLADLQLEPDPAHVETLTHMDEALYREIQARLPPGRSPGDFITSLKIRARRAG